MWFWLGAYWLLKCNLHFPSLTFPALPSSCTGCSTCILMSSPSLCSRIRENSLPKPSTVKDSPSQRPDTDPSLRHSRNWTYLVMWGIQGINCFDWSLIFGLWLFAGIGKYWKSLPFPVTIQICSSRWLVTAASFSLFSMMTSKQIFPLGSWNHIYEIVGKLLQIAPYSPKTQKASTWVDPANALRHDTPRGLRPGILFPLEWDPWCLQR